MSNVDALNAWADRSAMGPARYAVLLALAMHLDKLQANAS